MKKPSKDVDRAAAKIVEAGRQAGFVVGEPMTADEFFGAIDRHYRKPTLAQVIAEEKPIILEREPYFFQRYGIKLPKKPDVALFDLYWDEHGREGIQEILYISKVNFRHLRFFLIDHPDEERIRHHASSFRDIVRGKYDKSMY